MLGNDFFQLEGLALEILDFAGGRRPRCVAGQAPLAGFQELLRPAVVQALGDAFAPAELGDGDLAPQAVEDDAACQPWRVISSLANC